MDGPVFVYSKTPVSVSADFLLHKWPEACAKRGLKRRMLVATGQQVACVSMLAHPLAGKKMDTDTIIEIMCVDTGYTVYKKDDVCGDFWNLAASDSYHLSDEVTGKLTKENAFDRVKVSPHTFINEKDANDAIARNIRGVLRGVEENQWYDNHHSTIDEFVLNTIKMPCRGGACDGLSGRRFEDSKPLCVKCKPHDRHLGRTTCTPKVLDLSALKTEPMGGSNVFTVEGMVHAELVTFVSAVKLPFVKGHEDLDDKLTQIFLKCAKSVVYDIETITVDATLTNRIPDQIVTITAGFKRGQTLEKIVMFTQSIPDAWRDADGDVDTTAALESIRGPNAPPLPNTTVYELSGEGSVVGEFRRYLVAVKPHFLVSFNGHMFDHKFLIRASVANLQKPAFHRALNHLSSVVKTSTKDPLSTVSEHQLMRPAGKHCRGLIAKSVMEVTYDSFPSMLSIDLYLIHDSSLNEACRAKKVAGGKMEGVSHADIPKLYHGHHLDFFKYALHDVVITSDLYEKDYFDAVELFMELEKLVATPWNLSVSRQKTMPAQTTTYIQFQTNGFLREAKLKPKRVMASAVVDEVCRSMASTDARRPMLDETVQLLTDFWNGHCKCNTLFKKLPDIDREIVDGGLVRRVMKIQTSAKRASDPPYSTVDVVMLIHFLTRRQLDWTKWRPLLEEFGTLVKNDPKKIAALRNYAAYLVNVRRNKSPLHEDHALMWKEYKENYKADAVQAVVLKDFAERNHDAMMKLSAVARTYERPTKLTHEQLSRLVKTADAVVTAGGIKMKMLPYDGALIICPGPKIAFDYVVSVFDFRSQYPNAMLAINLGVETHVSLGVVTRAAGLVADRRGISLKEACLEMTVVEGSETGVVIPCNTRRNDDAKHWTDYLEHPDYLDANYVFFVANSTSVQNHQFKAEIDSRVVNKLKSEDASLSEVERRNNLNISTAKKVNINSRYGVIQTTQNPRFQPTVTSKGRCSIKNVTTALAEAIGTKDMYGDTDSCFTYMEHVNPFEMVRLSAAQVYELLKFGKFGVSYERFKTEMYDKHLPTDLTSPKAIRVACGCIVQCLYEVLAPIMSSKSLELEPEKTLAMMFLPSKKKYSGFNCATRRTLTKGLSLHNKSAFPATQRILTELNAISIDCWNEWAMARDLYDYIGKFVTVPIELGMVDPKTIAKPCAFSIGKVAETSKRGSLLASLREDEVPMVYEKIRVHQVTIFPEGDDKDWSLCDIQHQSCDDRVHVVKVKYDVMNELMNVLKAHFKQGVCGLFEALIWGEFYPDSYDEADFKRMDEENPKPFKAMSFATIVKKKATPNDVSAEENPPASKKKAPARKKKAPAGRKRAPAGNRKASGAPKKRKLDATGISMETIASSDDFWTRMGFVAPPSSLG